MVLRFLFEAFYFFLVFKRMSCIDVSDPLIDCYGTACTNTDRGDAHRVNGNQISKNKINAKSHNSKSTYLSSNPLAEKKTNLQAWSQFWLEWTERNCTREKDCSSTPSGKKVKLCYSGSGMRLEVCKYHANVDKLKACVGVESRQVDRCESFVSQKELHVPICKEKSSRKVITCGGKPFAYLCLLKPKPTSPVWPCWKLRYQLCLTNSGFLRKCRQRSKSKNSSRQNVDKVFSQMRNWSEWWKEWVIDVPGSSKENPENESTSLCIFTTDASSISKCNGVSGYRACVSAREGRVTLCRKMKNADIPITICMERFSPRVVTCGNYTSAFLCFSEVGGETKIRPCRVPSRRVCLSSTNHFIKCTSMIPPEDSFAEESNFVPRVHYPKGSISSFKSPSEKRLCYDPVKKMVVCEHDQNSDHVCIDERKGHVDLCKTFQSESKNHFHVCIIMNSDNAMKVCKGKHLCLYQEELRPCDNLKMLACVVKGLPQTCPATITAKEVPDFAEVTDYGNKETVYSAEKKLVKKVVKGLNHLCLSKEKGKFNRCSRSPDLWFACLEIKNGTVGWCRTYGPDALIEPLCVEESANMVVCGKISKVDVCGNDASGDVFPIRTCTNPKLFLCHDKSDEIKLCSKAERKTDFHYHGILDDPDPIRGRRSKEATRGHRSKESTRGHRIKESIRNRRSDEVLEPGEFQEEPNDLWQFERPQDLQNHNYLLEKDEEMEKERIRVPGRREPEITVPPYEYPDENEDDRNAGYRAEVKVTEDEVATQAKLFENKRRVLHARVVSSHLLNELLCLDSKEKLDDCDRILDVNFACVEAYGRRVKACGTIEAPDVAVPVCKKVNAPFFMTCDLFSNLHLCFPENEEGYFFEPCSEKSRFACLSNDYYIKHCSSINTTSTPASEETGESVISKKFHRKTPMQAASSKVLINRQKYVEAQKEDYPSNFEKHLLTHGSVVDGLSELLESGDEKFVKVNCFNCSVENMFEVEGEFDDDYYPVIDVITIPP